MRSEEVTVERLLEVMRRLRDPQRGCPWDREQSFETIAPYTIEEAYEVADAIDREDMGDLVDELGDLLFQVVFHAQMAAERDAFRFDDVVVAIVDKMVRRHPHVFGDVRVADAAAQTVAWEDHKAAERAARGRDRDSSVLDGVPEGLPALARARKLQARAARVGFDWPEAAAVLPKLAEELEELTVAMEAGQGADVLGEELGDLLFSCVNLARHLDLEPESTLRRANLKFARRFRALERLARSEGRNLEACSPAELETLWERAKSRERDLAPGS